MQNFKDRYLSVDSSNASDAFTVVYFCLLVDISPTSTQIHFFPLVVDKKIIINSKNPISQ